jgi:hypothetical protein
MFSSSPRDRDESSDRTEALTRLSAQVEKPPRHVEMGLRGRIFAAGVVLFSVLLVWSLHAVVHAGPGVDPVDLVFFVALIVVGLPVALKMSVRMLLQHRLLKNGTCSVGRVVLQQRQKGALGTRGMSRIVYEFPVGGHKAMTGRGVDWTSECKVDSPVLVFYDASDISKYVALCSTVWRVRSEVGVRIEP